MANKTKPYNVTMGNEGKTVQVFVYGTIWEDSWYIKQFEYDFRDATASKPDLIELRIHSGGGSVFNAYAMITIVRNCGVPVHAYIDGLAASAATILMLAADKVYMAEMSMLMIHNPSLYTSGDEHELRKAADMLAKIKTQMKDFYVQRTRLKPEDIAKMMDDETWFTPSEAKAKNLCDDVVKSKYVAPMDGWEPQPNTKMSVEKLFNHYTISMNNLQKPPVPPHQLTPVTDLWMVENRQSLELLLRYKDDPNERKVIEQLTAHAEAARNAQEEVKALRAEVAKLKAERIDMLIDAAVEEERITQAEAKNYKKIGDYEIVKNLLSSKKPALRPSQIIQRAFSSGEDRSDWTFQMWREKDPQGLEQMEEKDPERFDELYEAFRNSLKK